jgi:hypothetical protein
MCSLAARGLWIEFLGYMHEAEPYGHLLIDGRPPSIEGIAALVGRPVREVRKALAELDAQGVFSRQGGIVYSRRMVRDNTRSLEGQEHAEKRWPIGSPNRDPNGSPNGSPAEKEHGLPNAHIPEARSQKPERERKEDAPDGAPPAYAFESGVIRLNARDFDRWKAAFSHLDVPAELEGLSEWAEQQANWFHAVKGALAKRNREVGLQLEARRNGAVLTPSGNPWPEGIT